MTKYATFLGCLVPLRVPSAELAAERVFDMLDVDAVTLEDYSCCPDPVIARLMDKRMWLTLSARNLSLAEEQDRDIVTLCNGCYETLIEAKSMLDENQEMRAEVDELLSKIGREYKGNVEVKHVVEVLHEDVGLKKIKNHSKVPLNFKAGVHPGCHLFREPNGEDIWRKPKMLEKLVEVAGAEAVDCDLDRMCCGFPMMQVDEEFAVTERLGRKLSCYEESGVEGIVMPCPTCVTQFEIGQLLLRKYNGKYRFPCLHIIELIALTLGVPPKELSLKSHRSPVPKLIKKLEVS